MSKKLVSAALLPTAALAGAAVYGALKWKAGTRRLRTRLEAVREPVEPRRVDLAEVDGLPDPVRRYFRTVLEEGRPMVCGARVRHRGEFNMGEASDRWRPFTSDQIVVTRRPGFDWNARVSAAPGLAVRVHDAYVAGEGVLHAAVLGLFAVADMRGTREVAEGELMRFLAEAAWYPTALLPSQGVGWEEVDARSARATLVDGEVSVALQFLFGEDGTIESARAEARGRAVGGRVVPTPWRCRYADYREREGMLVPLEGEVAWLLPEGPRPYWRGRIVDIAYELASS